MLKRYLVRSRAAGIPPGTNHQEGSGVHIRCGGYATMGPPPGHHSLRTTVTSTVHTGETEYVNVNAVSWFSAP